MNGGVVKISETGGLRVLVLMWELLLSTRLLWLSYKNQITEIMHILQMISALLSETSISKTEKQVARSPLSCNSI